MASDGTREQADGEGQRAPKKVPLSQAMQSCGRDSILETLRAETESTLDTTAAHALSLLSLPSSASLARSSSPPACGGVWGGGGSGEVGDDGGGYSE
uniref:Uncharacterized protein n=1 Tax=Knipowitschia caucasica TaxID=637954 RepID=A0AAV2ML29_KNICA